MIKPIKPSEVNKKKLEIPDSIIECVNEMIVEKWNRSQNQSRIMQNDLMERVLKKNKTLKRDYIFANNLFDFEDIFTEAGWLVEYDRPGYNEDYEACFVFKKKRSK